MPLHAFARRDRRPEGSRVARLLRIACACRPFPRETFGPAVDAYHDDAPRIRRHDERSVPDRRNAEEERGEADEDERSSREGPRDERAARSRHEEPPGGREHREGETPRHAHGDEHRERDGEEDRRGRRQACALERGTRREDARDAGENAERHRDLRGALFRVPASAGPHEREQNEREDDERGDGRRGREEPEEEHRRVPERQRRGHGDENRLRQGHGGGEKRGPRRRAQEERPGPRACRERALENGALDSPVEVPPLAQALASGVERKLDAGRRRIFLLPLAGDRLAHPCRLLTLPHVRSSLEGVNERSELFLPRSLSTEARTRAAGPLLPEHREGVEGVLRQLGDEGAGAVDADVPHEGGRGRAARALAGLCEPGPARGGRPRSGTRGRRCARTSARPRALSRARRRARRRTRPTRRRARLSCARGSSRDGRTWRRPRRSQGPKPGPTRAPRGPKRPRGARRGRARPSPGGLPRRA